MKHHPGNRHRQSGAALLLIMLIIIVGAAAVLVTKLNRNTSRLLQTSTTDNALAVAKNALLDFATAYPDMNPGAAMQLPCPDIDGTGSNLDGEAHTLNCGAAGETVIGRLPWKTLGIPPPRDGAGECLWYIVSGEYKAAGAATSAMLNPDSNGQLLLYDSVSGALVEGATPQSRVVAAILAAEETIPGQSRQAAGPGQSCSGDFAAAAFLDADTGSGISNSVIGPGVVIDELVRAGRSDGSINDRIITVGREEIADMVYGRHDFNGQISAVAAAAAKCIAAYGLSNPGGPDDRRLPWPAAAALVDYRVDAEYDDVNGSAFSGRLADTTNDSSSATGNAIGRVLSDCSPSVVPEWDARMLALWRGWKDHFFYYVAESFSPTAAVPSACGDCLSVNSAGQFAAVVVFADRRLASASQVRNAPPLDADTKSSVANYLEGRNASSHPYTGGAVDLESRAADSSFNDILYCIDPSLAVSAC